MSLFSRKNAIINELIYLGTLPNFSKVSSQKLRSIVNSSCASSGQTTRTFADKKQHDAGEFLSSKKDANQNLGITWRLGLFYWRLWTFYFCLDSPPFWAFPLFVTFYFTGFPKGPTKGFGAADKWMIRTLLGRLYVRLRQALLARACGVSVGWRSGGRLATMLVATKNDILFSFLLFLRHLLFS